MLHPKGTSYGARCTALFCLFCWGWFFRCFCCRRTFASFFLRLIWRLAINQLAIGGLLVVAEFAFPVIPADPGQSALTMFITLRPSAGIHIAIA